MSVEAITWALKQPVPSSPAKFVLVVLANQANSETGISHPSVKYLQDATGQDRKTVLGNLKRLIEWRLIEDAGTRVGRTKQVVEYRLLCGADLFSGDVNSPKNGTVPKTGLFKKESTESNTSEKQSQKRNSSEFGTRNQELLKASRSTRACACAKAMIAAGFPAIRMNQTHPELLRAAEVCEPTELADIVTEVLARGGAPPGLAYVCTTAVNRRRDAAARESPDGNSTEKSRRGSESLADRAAARARRIFQRSADGCGREAGVPEQAGTLGIVAGHDRSVRQELDVDARRIASR